MPCPRSAPGQLGRATRGSPRRRLNTLHRGHRRSAQLSGASGTTSPGSTRTSSSKNGSTDSPVRLPRMYVGDIVKEKTIDAMKTFIWASYNAQRATSPARIASTAPFVVRGFLHTDFWTSHLRVQQIGGTTISGPSAGLSLAGAARVRNLGAAGR